MNTSPPAVTIGPPRLGDPHSGSARSLSPVSAEIVPSGTSQRRLPVLRLIATSVPKGGGVHGILDGDSSMRRRITYGVPRMKLYS
jgi:hypothetical protein